MLAGDAANMVANLDFNLPSGIFSDGQEYMDSMALIRKYADFMIGGHELEIKPFQTDNFPKVNQLK